MEPLPEVMVAMVAQAADHTEHLPPVRVIHQQLHRLKEIMAGLEMFLAHQMAVVVVGLLR